MSYQSFGDKKGDSDSLGKLKAIHLPTLRGKSFLDVGCNAGFFCEAAFRAGASQVIGIDQNEEIISSAQNRYPHISFQATDWHNLPETLFDVVILLSALHYADDQEALIDLLMQRVEKNGVLILEVGIAPGTEVGWVETKRSVDTRLFPTLSMMQKMLDKFTYRLIGPSVSQAGDPNPRFVFHVWHRRPMVLACLMESGTGKSSLARLAANGSNGAIKIFHVDNHLVQFCVENLLIEKLDSDGLPQPIDLSQLYIDICKQGLADDFADYIATLCRDKPLALIEGGLPYGYRTQFLNRLGYLLDADIWSLSPSSIYSINHTRQTTDTSNLGCAMQPLQTSENHQIVGT